MGLQIISEARDGDSQKKNGTDTKGVVCVSCKRPYDIGDQGSILIFLKPTGNNELSQNSPICEKCARKGIG